VHPHTILHELTTALDPLLSAVTWAWEEITAAGRRHPDAADRIERSFALLRPTDGLTRTEAAYRSHCRELLDRLAAGEDTRPATAAECCVALCETSLRVPLSTSAAGLYARMWRLAGLPTVDLADAGEHYEALEGSRIDEHEAWLRRRLRQDWRVPPDTGTPPARRRPRRRAG
jgi:hypothetical protein